MSFHKLARRRYDGLLDAAPRLVCKALAVYNAQRTHMIGFTLWQQLR